MTAALEADFSQPTADDSQSVELTVNQREPILVIGDPAAAALLRVQGFDVEEGTAARVSAPLGYSAIIVRSGSGAFSSGQLTLLESYVRNGGGLMMTGGADSFGFGAWYRTPVEAVLPVNTDLRSDVEIPLVALAIVLDRSMSMTAGNPTRLDLAKEGAIGVVDLAYQDDLLGLVVFSDANLAQWAFELRPATQQGKREMLSAILSIQAQGGTILEPAYRMAITALSESEAAIKHIVVLSDGKLFDGMSSFGGQNSGVDFNTMAREALTQSITTSTIAVGDDADFEQLSGIARAGGGRYYEALDVRTLPQIFTTEALTTSRSLLRENALNPALRTHPLAPASGPVPTIDAYIATTLKPTAEIILAGLQSEPILAVSRQGLGRSAALTTDLNSWAGELADWSELPALLGTVVRWLQTRPATYAATIREQGARLHVLVDAVEDGEYINNKTLVTRYGGVQQPLEQVGPGRYEGFVPLQAGGDMLLVLDGDDIVARSQVRSANAEFDTRGGAALLQTIAERTGGTFYEFLESYAPQMPPARTSLWFYPALAGLAIFLSELFLRRFSPQS